MEAQKFIWQGAIPLQIHLHESEVTSLPPPPPALILAPRIGYLPLLASHIRPHFSGALPPGVEAIWFEYKGLPLKWYIPTGVLFDLLCAEPERPWNLTVHFRGYPGHLLIPCENEDSVKWSFINSLKEAAYIINGNCKIVMNMSQPDQMELWHSVLYGSLEGYRRVSSKLKLSLLGNDDKLKLGSSSFISQEIAGGTDVAEVVTGRVPVRLYLRSMRSDINDLEDLPQIESWDEVSYINRPVEIHGEEGKCFTLHDAVKSLLPEFFIDSSSTEEWARVEGEDAERVHAAENNYGCAEERRNASEGLQSRRPSSYITGIKLIRIQGIEPRLEIPFSWVVKNLVNPEHFLHMCVFLEVSRLTTT